MWKSRGKRPVQEKSSERLEEERKRHKATAGEHGSNHTCVRDSQQTEPLCSLERLALPVAW